MSAQDDIAIPFEIDHEQQNFRLLELPPALLELIVSQNPHSFLLKSTKPESKYATNFTQHNAVLCTHNQTLNIRQVQSSNSVFLIEPTQCNPDPERGLLGDISVRAIAQCAATLELIPASVDGASILKRILPTYNIPTDGVERDDDLTSYEKLSKEAVFENTPLSRQQFNDTWKNACAFELHGVPFLPSAICLASIWKSIMSTATRNSINVAENFRILDLIEIVDEDGFPKNILTAVIRRLVVDSEDITEDMEMINRDECVSWVGNVILEAQLLSQNTGFLESDFLNEWQNQLPEKWRGHAKLSALKCKYSRQSNEIVKFEPNDLGSSQSSIAPNADGKRLGKWHERFKSTRR